MESLNVAVSLAELEVLISLQTIGQGQINSLKGSLLGLGTGAGLAAIGIGGLYEVGKSAVENAEAHEAATRSLSQAFLTQGKAVPTKEIQTWLDKNKDFIGNQYDAENAIAAATRAGISWKDTQLLMGDALDLSINRHESMSDAMETLIKAAKGGRNQLADLGISEADLQEPTKNLAQLQKDAATADTNKAKADRALQEELDRLHGKHTITQADLDHLADLKAKDLEATNKDKDAHNKLAGALASTKDQGDKVAQMHDLLHPKLQGETDSVTDLQRKQNDLNRDWQDFTQRIGPPLLDVLDRGVAILDEIVQAVDLIAGAKNPLQAVGTALTVIGEDTGLINTNHGPGGRGRYGGYRQFGGSVSGGQSYLVGEAGPELLTLGSGASGHVTPNGQLTDMTETNELLRQQVDISLALLNKIGGGGYAGLADLEYARSRGIH